MSDHHDFMQLALAQARLGLGRCAPNPAVGAVLVRDGEVLASGHHHGPGQPHAEVEALRDVDDATDCDLYVTLEPCCHYGRTPPCTDLIIEKHVSRVFFGYLDPNPVVAGNGQMQLQQAGIPCELVSSAMVEFFYAPYKHWTLTKMPWVTVKIALSDRGELAIDPLTGFEAKRATHQSRLEHDAILTTANTIIHDDPQMNTRLINASIKKPLFILDSQLRTPSSSKIFNTCEPVTIFHAEQASDEKKAVLSQCGAILKSVRKVNNLLDWQAILSEMGQQGIQRLWVEAGWRCASSLISQNLMNELICYVAAYREGVQTRPIELCYEGGMNRDVRFNMLGNDFLILIR